MGLLVKVLLVQVNHFLQTAFSRLRFQQVTRQTLLRLKLISFQQHARYYRVIRSFLLAFSG